MKGFKLKILLILLILVPLPLIPFSCKDKNDCLDLDVEPYYVIEEIDFQDVTLYWINPKDGVPAYKNVSQDFDNTEYPCDSMMLSFEATDLSYQSYYMIPKTGFSFTQELFACEPNRAGYKGSLEMVDKIYISSNYDFDETHKKSDNMSDIVDIFAYSHSGPKTWMSLLEYNNNSPYEAPKRFSLYLTRKPTRSKVQQFVIRYLMLPEEPGKAPKYWVITTPKFNVK